MSTAVLEEPEVAKAPKPAWRMPEIAIGQQVFWYEYADRGRAPQRALVESVVGDTISCRLMTGGLSQYKSCARHVSDPFIAATKGNCVADVDQGGWDYTSDYKAEMEWRKSVEERLARMERVFRSPERVELLSKGSVEVLNETLEESADVIGFGESLKDSDGKVAWDKTPADEPDVKDTPKGNSKKK